MGIVIRQSFYNSIFSYIGAGIGLLNVGIIMPNLFSTSQVGLINLLLALSAIFAQFGTLGFTNVITRDFTFFRDKENSHSGFASLILLIAIIGFCISIAIFFGGQDYFLKRKLEENELLNQFYLFIVPLIGFGILYSLFDVYTSVLYKSVLGVFLKEVLLRIINLALLYLFFRKVIDFNLFVIGYTLAFGVPSILLIFYLSITGHFKMTTIKISAAKLKSMIHLAFYSQISALIGIVILNVDKVIIQKLINLSQTGVYSIAFLFGFIVILPGKSIGKITSVFIAESWKETNYTRLSEIYKKTCQTMLFLASIAFLLICTNMDLIFHILPAEYEGGRIVVYLIGLSSVIEMSTGMSGTIIATSSHFRQYSLIYGIYLIVYVVLCLLLIPQYSIVGAAISNVVCVFLFNLLRHIYIWQYMGMQPFEKKNVVLFLFLICSLVIFLIAPTIPISNVFIRSVVYTIFVISIYTAINEYFKIIPELSIKQLYNLFADINPFNKRM